MRRWLIRGLGALSIVLLVAPVVAPPSGTLIHDTAFNSNHTSIEEASDRSYAIYHERNLSDRARTLYRKALENGGIYRVPAGDGASEFRYPDASSIEAGPGERLNTSRFLVAIVRANDSTLPPANEELGTARIEVMATVTKKPSLLSVPYILRYVSLLAGTVLLVSSVYLRFHGTD